MKSSASELGLRLKKSPRVVFLNVRLLAIFHNIHYFLLYTPSLKCIMRGKNISVHFLVILKLPIFV